MSIRSAIGVFSVCGLCTSVLAAGTTAASVSAKPAVGPTQTIVDASMAVGVVCSSAECIGCDATSAVPVLSEAEQAEMQRRAEALIEAQTFWSLPAEDRATITKTLEAMGEAVPSLTANERVHPEQIRLSEPLTADEFQAAWEQVAPFVERDVFATFSPIHQRMLRNFAVLASGDDWTPVMPCFTPGVDFDLIKAFEEVISFGMSNLEANNPLRFEQIARWNGTALDPSGGGQGNPTTLTYSFPDDGTFIASGVGEPAGPNDLNAFMDGIYGDRATWRTIYDDIFARWGELSGNTYVLETNDDNENLFDFPGVSGTRGDLRMGGKFIDGNSGTLAYNFFPQNGDMVVDTGDNFYNNTTGDSIRLRNILLHEHGHGMGQLHTCPIEQEKLMEPFISLAFSGPQYDDILNAQRHYGDPNDPNDSASVATSLGTIAVDGSASVDTVSIDDENDVDVYAVTLTQPVSLTATLTIGLPADGQVPYGAGPQTGSCSESQPYDPTVFLNPALEILDSNGATVLALSDANPAGSGETVSADVGPGTFYVRATGGSPAGDQIIAYELDVNASFDGLNFAIIDTLPTELVPGVATSFLVGVEPDGESLVGTPQIAFRRAADASFTSVDLVNISGDTWRADLPAFLCGEDPEYFLTADGTVSGQLTLPDPSTVQTIVTDGDVSSVEDPADTDLGYTTGGNAGDGQWTLGAPQGNDRGDPAVDADGSGSAWLTDINLGNDNSDVDDGEVTLTTPVLDLVAGSTVSYAYWFNDIPGGPVQGGDSFRVQVSTNGGASFSTIRTFTTASGAWRCDTLVEGVDYTGAAAGQGQLRFIVNDIGTQNVIEGGVDAIVISTSSCTDPTGGPCSPAAITTAGTSNGVPDGAVTLSDISFYLSLWSASDAAADLTTDGTSNGVPDGAVTLSDFSFYLSLWSAGCP